MKALLIASVQAVASQRAEQVRVGVEVPNADAELYSVLGHLAEALHAYRTTRYVVRGVTVLVGDCSPAFFAPHHCGPAPVPGVGLADAVVSMVVPAGAFPPDPAAPDPGGADAPAA